MEKVIVQRKNSVLVTEKELTIIQNYADGLRAKDIAHTLKISPRTVEFRLMLLQRKTDAKSLPHLIAIFFREGLIK